MTEAERAYLRRRIDEARRALVGERLADDFLAAFLADGPRHPRQVLNAAKLEGYNSGALTGARSRLGVVRSYDETGRLQWELPGVTAGRLERLG